MALVVPSWKRMVRSVALAAAGPLVLAAGLAAPATGSAAAPPTNPKHFFWAQGQSPQGTVNSLTNDIIYHGGNAGPGAIGVETKPAVYLIFWGPEWKTGFNNPDEKGNPHSSARLQTYVKSFFQNVGGSPWGGVQTQYCKNVPAGTTSCTGIPGAVFVTNPTGQLKGSWTDTTPVPSDIITLGLAENLVDDPLAFEAQRAAAHFGFNPQATYIILTPPSTIGTGQPVYCGYHTQTTSVDGYGNPFRIQYSFIPYLNLSWPLLGDKGCGKNNVNASSDSFGHGVFDGYSIVTGHEYAEAVTDPDNFFSVQDGWNDASTSENGDKCAWYHTQNVAMGAYSFAVQPMWSNEAFDAGKDGCAVSR
jgi:serine protease